MLNSMPQTVLIGKLCPKGMEAQTFAVLAALSNFGSNVAFVNGAIAAQVMGVSFAKLSTNPPGPLGIRQLGWLKLLATFWLPLATVPFTWLFLPDINLNDDFLTAVEDQTELTENLEPGTSFAHGSSGAGGGNSKVTGSFLGGKSDDQQMWVSASRKSLVSIEAGGRGGGGAWLL